MKNLSHIYKRLIW